MRSRLWRCQVSNAIKERKPKVRSVFKLRYQATPGFMVNLINLSNICFVMAK